MAKTPLAGNMIGKPGSSYLNYCFTYRQRSRKHREDWSDLLRGEYSIAILRIFVSGCD